MAKKSFFNSLASIARIASLSTVLAFCLAAKANAAPIIMTTGAITEIDAPVSVATGAFESDDSIFIFLESINVAADDLAANFGTVPAGARFDSHLIHFDRIGMVTPALNLQGSVTFGGDILGIDFFDGLLNTRDGIFGAPGTTYATGENLRGLESNGTDSLIVNARTLTLSLFTDFWVDNIRVYTVSVPAPSTLMLLGLGLVGLLSRTRRRTNIR